jgi:hypothetical protein
MIATPTSATARRIFMILSPRSLAYARYALQSLLNNSLEPLHVHLVTDSASDKQLLLEETADYSYASMHRCSVFAKGELDDREAETFAGFPNLRLFRQGHPCWRKITDPLLMSSGEEEIVVLDPDLYFPNRFRFEATPDRGLLLMWQRPNCLFPAEIVDSALRNRISLAHHVDIGVAHWRAEPDLDWLEWLVQRLGIAEYPNARFSMHIEAIVWAAIAMRAGGGYLPSDQWYCWRRSQRIRVLRRLGVSGPRLIRREPFSHMKCFHAGGEAKYWLQGAKQGKWLDSDKLLDKPGIIRPFVELTPRAYRREQVLKACLKRFGYYNLFPSGALP